MPPMPESILSLFALEPLIGSALRSTALIAIAALVALAARRSAASVRHLVWTLALLGCIAMPVASRVIPGWSVAALPAWEESTKALPERATLGEPVTAGAPAEGRDRTASEPATLATSTAEATPSVGRVGSWRPGIEDVRRLVPLLWLAGVLLLAARHLLGWASLARIARRAAPVASPAWQIALARQGAALGLRRLPDVRVSPAIAIPIVCGVWRPTILVPGEALDWSSERRDAVLLHELAHVRRRDLHTARMTQLVLTLYWFNPFVWVAAHRQRAEAERACDDQVLDAGGRASAYASDLLEIARATGGRGHLDAAALAMARRSQLEGRLLAILDPGQVRGRAGRVAISLSLLLAVTSIGVLAAVRPAQSRRAPEGVAPQVATVVTQGTEAASPGLVTTTPGAGSAARTSASGAPTSRVSTTAPSAASAPPHHSDDASLVAQVAAPPPPPAAPVAPARPAKKVAAPPGPPAPPAAPVAKSSWSIVDNGLGTVRSGNWNNRESRGSYKSKGTIRYSRALDDIESISSGGYVEIDEDRGRTSHRALFKNRSGAIERYYSVDGEERPWDAAARAWFADFLVELDHGSGMLVEQRFPRLMAEGGPNRVLGEVSQMSSDYGRGIYLRKLLESDLDDATLRRLVTQAGREIDSDYELAQALIAAAKGRTLDNAETASGYLGAVGTLESDYEHGRTLQALVERRNLSPALVMGIIESASRMASDYERAQLMIALAEKGHVKLALQPAFIRAARDMSSDYERGRVLRALIEHGPLAGDNVDDLLAGCASFSSDYERANVLVHLAENVQMSASQREAFLQATRQFSSDYERGRALTALAGR